MLLLLISTTSVFPLLTTHAMSTKNLSSSRSMEEKINRILENTEATRRNFDDYQSTNDLHVSQLEAELKDLKERFIDSEARKSTENGYAALLSSTDVKIAKQQALKTHISSGLIVVKFSSFETKLEVMAAKKTGIQTLHQTA